MALQPEIRRLRANSPADWFVTIASLHSDHIEHGLLPMLGRPFLARLYKEMTGSDSAAVWVALNTDRVVGFLAGTFDDRAMYRDVMRRAALPLAKLALPSVGRVLWRTVASTIRYVRRRRTMDASGHPTGAELLAIAVGPEARRTGAGAALVAIFETELAARSIGSYYVTTNAVEEVSNEFYRALGFAFVGTMPHHALTLNVYEKRLAA